MVTTQAEVIEEVSYEDFMRRLAREHLTKENLDKAAVVHFKESRTERLNQGHYTRSVRLWRDYHFFAVKLYPPDVELLENEIGVKIDDDASPQPSLIRYTEKP